MRTRVDNERATSSLVLCLQESSDLWPSPQTSYVECLFFKDIANDIYVRGARPEIERTVDSWGFDGHATDKLFHQTQSVELFQYEAVWIPLAHDGPPELTFEAAEKCGFNQIPHCYARAVHEIIGRLQPYVAQRAPLSRPLVQIKFEFCFSAAQLSGIAQTVRRAAQSAVRHVRRNL